jgi:hypothetical protein
MLLRTRGEYRYPQLNIIVIRTREVPSPRDWERTNAGNPENNKWDDHALVTVPYHV